MATPKLEGVVFEVSIIGETTSKQFFGKFRCKEKLSLRDQLNIDKIRRELIGPNPLGADGDTAAIAAMVAELSVRLTEAPTFWTETKNGLDLEDLNVLLEVFQKAMEVQKAYMDEVKKDGEEAKASLRDLREEKAQK